MNQLEYIDVAGEEIKIWSPVTLGSGYAVSDCGGWLDGSYDSRDAAILGYRLSISQNGYTKLAELRDKINRDKNHPRKITVDDFDNYIVE